MSGRIHRLFALVALAAAVTAFAACGPSLYTFNVIPASQAVEQARQANAPDHAPYEFFIAEAYLDKAREEAAEANYQDAVRFAERANEFGTKARDLARRRMREQGR
ncbi:MAG: DUF4398 domain-containing protein [Sandaracinaceae bacterium]|nr:DUF4398 domain-containing protein [Sandaracinaceae bacterium]